MVLIEPTAHYWASWKKYQIQHGQITYKNFRCCYSYLLNFCTVFFTSQLYFLYWSNSKLLDYRVIVMPKLHQSNQLCLNSQSGTRYGRGKLWQGMEEVILSYPIYWQPFIYTVQLNYSSNVFEVIIQLRMGIVRDVILCIRV